MTDEQATEKGRGVTRREALTWLGAAAVAAVAASC